MKSQLWTAPNQLTLLRLFFVPFVIINVLDGNFGWALGLFVLAALSDGLDGLLARLLEQKTTLGQYLDPLADKLLLSSLFLVLSFTHYIPWKYTVLVFLRDISILVVAAVLYATTNVRDFRPSIFGKLNTTAQVGAVFFVLLAQIRPELWIQAARQILLYSTFALTLVSGIHYSIIVGHRLHAPDKIAR
ncbi:MAG TPA: CDP-alcohol phosphatidyltransferase family protein [Clostridia bacterium]|nr:CDP-alcohol phosphatidyltransferase family protein [Clostridia bacterium]